MEETIFVSPRRSGCSKWLMACLTAGMLCQSAQAVQDTFNNTDTYFSGSGAPTINATNFVNDYSGSFDVAFTNGLSSGWLSGLFQNWFYVRNFSNYNLMQCNTGFRFDRQIGSQHLMSDSFYNEGNINCGVTNDTLVGIYVYATNIFNSGTVTIGQNGLGRFSGKDINFTRGTVRMTNTTGFLASPVVGTDTNSDWFPSFDLLPGSAFSSYPVYLYLTNSKSYFRIQPNGSPTNFIVRVIFVQNVNTNVGYNVFIDNLDSLGFSTGGAHIEWYGAYRNIANGLPATNYLYLNNNYVLGSSTNVFNVPASGLPINYTFQTTSQPLGFTNPLAVGYPTFPDGFVTNNIYSYVDAQFIRSSVDTNSVQNGAITNLPGRIEIIATNSLSLDLAAITGMNYLLLRSTNQFNNDGNSQIISPYTDMYLGATNCNLVISNVLAGEVPVWSGSVQAWTTRWFAGDGINNYDFRVLLVNADVVPTNGALVQDCVLYSSNNLVVSDVLNIIRTFSANCTNLLITTNDVASGAANNSGQILLNSTSFFWSNCVPRLRVLTNNGAIATFNVANYGGVNSPYYTLLNSGYINNGNGAFIYANDFENSGYFSAGAGSFSVRSQSTKITNGIVTANGTFTNVSSTFVATNSQILIGKSINLIVTNLLTDYGNTSNFWSLGSANGGAGVASGLFLPIKPAAGDLLGTSITNIATTGTLINNTWSAQDRGYSVTGYSNNAALGQLICVAGGANPKTQFYFAGTAGPGITNAIYVDNLVLVDYATNVDASYNVKSLVFSNNLVIYYAQALFNGVTVAEKLNHKNGDHLRWIPSYAGNFSSTQLVYPPGVTNTVNAALAQSTSIDSDGDGIPNASDPTPFFVPALLDFTISVSNTSPKSLRLQWQSIPNSTNFIFYTTNLLSPWQPFTGFNRWYYGSTGVTNAAHVHWFASPLAYPSNPPVNDFRTNVWVFDAITNVPHFYRVLVQPWLTYPN